MSLLVGDPVTCSKIELFLEDPYAADVKQFANPGTVIRRGKNDRPKPKNIHSYAMLASYPSIASDFQSVVRNWFRVASELEPVVDLFTTVGLPQSSLLGSRVFIPRPGIGSLSCTRV